MVADTTLATTQSFQEKMYERIRDSIGELMSEEDLKKLTAAAIERAFFEPRVTETGYGHVTKTESRFVEMVEKLMRSRVEQAVSAWIETHPDEIKERLDETIGRGMVGLVVAYLESKVAGPLSEFAQQLQSQLNIRNM